MDWMWSPVSFCEPKGCRRADQEDKVVAVWKPFCEDAEPPRLLSNAAQAERDREQREGYAQRLF